MTNISNMFLTLNAGDWKLVPSTFMISLKWPDKIPSSGHFQQLIFAIFNCPFLTFSKKWKILGFWHNWLLINCSRLLNWKRFWTQHQYSKLFKRFLKTIALFYVYQLAKFGELISWDSKGILKSSLSFVLILIMTSQVWKIMRWVKIEKLEYLDIVF